MHSYEDIVQPKVEYLISKEDFHRAAVNHNQKDAAECEEIGLVLIEDDDRSCQQNLE